MSCDCILFTIETAYFLTASCIPHKTWFNVVILTLNLTPAFMNLDLWAFEVTDLNPVTHTVRHTAAESLWKIDIAFIHAAAHWPPTLLHIIGNNNFLFSPTAALRRTVTSTAPRIKRLKVSEKLIPKPWWSLQSRKVETSVQNADLNKLLRVLN